MKDIGEELLGDESLSERVGPDSDHSRYGWKGGSTSTSSNDPIGSNLWNDNATLGEEITGEDEEKRLRSGS